MTAEEKLEKLTAWLEKMSAWAEAPDQEYWTWGNADDTYEYGRSLGFDDAVKEVQKILEG